jgi:hypothetical protein
MYRDRPALADTLDLDQGDILRGVLRPQAVTGRNFAILKDGSKFRYPAPAEAVLTVSEELRVVSKLEKVDLCIVLSNSCDNSSEHLPVLLAPARPFAFEAEGHPDRWLEISTAATGTANPKFFYLTDSSAHSIERSEAQFNLIFSISHDYLRRCVREAETKRVCGITPEAQLHLQWAVNLFFGRHAREDLDWPSENDLKLKIEWLEAEISRGGRFQNRHKAELELTKAELRKRQPSGP